MVIADFRRFHFHDGLGKIQGKAEWIGFLEVGTQEIRTPRENQYMFIPLLSQFETLDLFLRQGRPVRGGRLGPRMPLDRAAAQSCHRYDQKQNEQFSNVLG
jgi:hypothetical protein